MLRITVGRQPRRITLTLEGRLLGPWVAALEEAWLATLRDRESRPIVVDLTGVTFVDSSGRELLLRMGHEGARLVAAGIEGRMMVARIQRDVVRRREAREAVQCSRGDGRSS